jgi:hypothetical protein
MADVHSDAFERLVEQLGRQLTADSARKIGELRVDSSPQDRIDLLAERNAEGLITDEERQEFEVYVSAAGFLSVLQAEARRMFAVGVS